MTTEGAGLELVELIAGRNLDDAIEQLDARRPPSGETIEELLDVAGRAVTADPDLASLALELVDRLAPAVGADHGVPSASYLRARSALNGGRADEALLLIERARSGWLELGRPLDAFRTELGRMHVLDDLGRHDDAADAARSLLAALANADDGSAPEDRDQIRWMRAAANENLGVASGFTGHHAEALAAYEMAEEVYRSVGGLDDLARCRANRGVELVAVGRAVEGLDALLSACTMFDEAGNRLSYAQCLGHAAEAELLLGLYAASLERFRQAGRLLEDLGATTEASRLRLRTIRAYLALNLIDEAATLATEVEAALSDLGLQHDLAEGRWVAGVVALRAEAPEDAIDVLDRAIDGAALVGDAALGARAQLARSEAFANLGRGAEATAAAEAASAAVDGQGWPVEEFHCHLRLAQLHDDREVVEQHLQQATELVDELGLPQLRYPLLVQLGRWDRQRGDHALARRRLEEAIDILEDLRGLIPDEILRSSYLEGRTTAHIELISMLIDGSNDERQTAFDLAEASKARTLDDLMAGVVRPARSPDEPVLARYEADLHAAYSALTSGVPNQTRSQRRALQDRAVELEQAIRLGHLRSEAGLDRPVPADRPTNAVDHRPPRPRPGAGEQVIEYHVIGERIAIFVWRNGRLDVVEATAGAGRIDELVGDWERTRQRYELARGLGAGATGGLVEAAEDALRALWGALFAPVAPLLDQGGEILIIPHGALHVVPFHALVGSDGPVGRRWTVTMAPSYAVARGLPERSPAGARGRSVVVGVPDEATPAVAEEARRTAGLLPGAELLLGCQATVDNLRAATARPVDVLHLACHGLHRPRNPMFSAVKLSDRWLTAQDVLGLSVPGALVVLSACESGRQQPGQHREETIGLARSFVAAGAAAVIVSLWMTDDRVAAELMSVFYDNLTGASPATALRVAQTAVAAQHTHPADWAPFIIYAGSQG